MLPRDPDGRPRDLTRPLEQIEIVVDQERDGQRLDQALQSYLPWRSRTSVCRLIDEGLIDHGERPRASRRVKQGDRIVVRIPADPVPDVGPQDFEIPILYEDRHVIAVDKPPGLAVHPAGRRLYGTLIHFLHKRYRRPDDPAHDVVPRLLHRIDRETSGVVAAGLEEVSHGQIRKQFEARTVDKTYFAVVHGRPPKASGTIDIGIGPARNSAVRLKLEARDDGQPASTDYRVVRTTRSYALVELVPRTGRTHQLRVHMASVGCPLVGDKIYGVGDNVFLEYLDGALSDASRAQLVLDRHALHAAKLRFWHPVRDSDLVLEAPLPADMLALLDGDV